MSTKFEKLLDYLVNEEIDKANDLFHEIVVEKSRTIYENLIDEEDSEEGHEELEDSFVMDADDDTDDKTDDKTDDLEADIETDDGEDMGGLDDEESREEQAMFDIKNAIEELEAAFAELESAQGGEMGDDEFGDDEFGDDEGDDEFGSDEEDLQMGMLEGRRLREYTEKVGTDWDKNAMKGPKGEPAGAGTGEFNRDGETNPKSPISSGKNKPGPAGVGAGNIAQGSRSENQDGTRPHGKAGGFLSSPKDMNTGNGNVPGGKMGVKNLSKVPGGHGAEKKGAGPGPVGAGTGEKAGQTSIDPATSKQFLNPYSK
jgi:hypothetical protein